LIAIKVFKTRYDSPMRKLLAIFFLALTCSLAFAGTGSAVTKAYADSKGTLHIVTDDGRDYTIKPEKWQSGGGFGDVVIAPDGKTVGWLVKQMLIPLQAGASYSYAAALEIDIWRDGRVIRRIGTPALTIQNWIFLKDGDEVAFHRAPPHGQEFYECILMDVNTGKEQSHWSLDRKDYVVPDWAKPLLVDDPPPGPNEIHWWFPDAPAQMKEAPQSKPQ
jgi:hypothetical protein